MTLKEEKIYDRIEIVERNFKFLKNYEDMPPSEFLSHFKDIQATKFCLLEIIESCIDIGSYIITIRNLNHIETYADVFEVLGNHHIIKNKLAQNLMNMARFRNVLVHQYTKVDNLKVLEFIQNELADIHNFISSIILYLEKNGEEMEEEKST